MNGTALCYSAPQLPPPSICNVLVLDDCSFDRRRIRRLIAHAGLAVSVHEAADLSRLEVLLDEHVFDLCILDCLLPSGSGLDAAQMLRTDAGHSRTPVIMVSGALVPGGAPRVGHRPYDLFLAKSELTPKAMRELMADALAARMERHDAVTEEQHAEFAARRYLAFGDDARDDAGTWGARDVGRRPTDLLPLPGVVQQLTEEDGFDFH